MAHKTTRKGAAPPAQPATTSSASPTAASTTSASPTHAPPTSVWGKATNPLTSTAQPSAAIAAQAPTTNGAVAAEKEKEKPKDKPSTPPTTSSPTFSSTQPSPSPTATPSLPSPTPSSTPSSTSSSTISPFTLSSLTVGSLVRCTTTLSETIQGSVFCYDPSTSILALEIPHPNSHPSFSMLNLTALTSLTIVRPSSVPARVLPEVDQARLAGKEARGVGVRQEEARKIGVGVTGVGQRVFDALAKLYGAVWEGRVIVLMDGMRLKEPYTEEQLTGGTAQQRQRIMKTIQQAQATTKEGNSK